jgi:hypothetical protein
MLYVKSQISLIKYSWSWINCHVKITLRSDSIRKQIIRPRKCSHPSTFVNLTFLNGLSKCITMSFYLFIYWSFHGIPSTASGINPHTPGQGPRLVIPTYGKVYPLLCIYRASMIREHISLNSNVNGSVKAVKRELDNTKRRQSATNCQPTALNVPEEQRSQLHRSGNLKPRMTQNSLTVGARV